VAGAPARRSCNVDAGLTTTADDVKPFLIRQVTSPVR
jgi:hypothetical protein